MSILTDLRDVVRAAATMLAVQDARLVEVERASLIRTCNPTAETRAALGFAYTVVKYRRQDNTMAMVSTLTNLDATTGLYARRTETYYSTNGSIVLRTVTLQITYDDNRYPVAESIISVVTP